MLAPNPGVARTYRSKALLLRSTATLFASVVFSCSGCARPIRATIVGPPSQAQLAQLWVEPAGNRDLEWGVGGKTGAPDPDAQYVVIDIKRGGFSRGYTVTGPGGREWSVKFPPEASTEVTASRILWAAGYHQPPIYYVARWDADKAPGPNPQLPARFREKDARIHGRIALEEKGVWSYYQNPFVGTRELNGLLVLQALLGNSDLKDENNALYQLKEGFEGATKWYVVRDLGHTFGRTGVISAARGDVEVFEETPFIEGVANGRVKLNWHGRHDALFNDITPADVRWICGRLQKLTDEQWFDAFRAGGYSKATSDRFVRKMKQKIAEGLALKG
jgi:hypothetical protein